MKLRWIDTNHNYPPHTPTSPPVYIISPIPDSLLSLWSKQTNVLSIRFDNSPLLTCSWSGSEVLHTFANVTIGFQRELTMAWRITTFFFSLTRGDVFIICRGERYPSENKLYLIYRLKAVINSVYLYQFNVSKDLVAWLWSLEVFLDTFRTISSHQRSLDSDFNRVGNNFITYFGLFRVLVFRLFGLFSLFFHFSILLDRILMFVCDKLIYCQL